MKTCYYLLLIICCGMQLANAVDAQTIVPGIAWQQTIGGKGTDVLTAMCINTDKSVVLCGYSNSGKSGNKTAASFGGYDYWIVKLDANGNTLWNKTYGGSNDDFAAAITTTSDGGYLVGGSSISNTSGSKSSNSYGNSLDYWVLKLDGRGNKVWDKTIGGISTERLTSVAELPGKVYLLGGYAFSDSNGVKTQHNLGSENNADYWTVLLNADGSLKSQYVFGGVDLDVLTCVSPAGVSGFYAAGYSYSDKLAGSKSLKAFGNNDYWVLRSNLAGKFEFQGTFGNNYSDYLTCMHVLPDSSLIFGGYSNSDPGNAKSGAFFGLSDFWLLKLKQDGTKQWDKTFGGAGADYMTSVQQTKDKGFIVGGYSNSNIGNTKTASSKGGFDYWIVKTDSAGKVQWDKTIGGTGGDTLNAIYEIASNEYMVAGTSGSPISGDKTSAIIGGSKTDYWVMKLTTAPTFTASAAANSSLKENTAAQKSNDNQLELTPDPVKDALMVCYTTTRKANFVIYAANGKALMQFSLSAGKGMRTFNIAGFAAGNYYAVLYAENLKLSKAFTRQ